MRSHLFTRRFFLRCSTSLCFASLLVVFSACSKPPAEAAAAARITASGPVGLFFMTRYWGFSGSLEKSVWYFTDDGKVYENLTSGLTPADLEAHKGRKGTFKLDGGSLAVTWSDGKITKSRFEPDKNGPSFGWDTGLFTPARPFTDPSVLVGKYEGGESLSHGGDAVITSNTFEFRADGTFARSGLASVKTTSDRSVLSGNSQGGSAGTWKAEAYSITLTGSDGTVTRKIAFPYYEDPKSVKPERIYYGGLLMKRQ